jgi:hypothetical protein
MILYFGVKWFEMFAEYGITTHILYPYAPPKRTGGGFYLGEWGISTQNLRTKIFGRVEKYISIRYKYIVSIHLNTKEENYFLSQKK